VKLRTCSFRTAKIIRQGQSYLDQQFRPKAVSTVASSGKQVRNGDNNYCKVSAKQAGGRSKAGPTAAAVSSIAAQKIAMQGRTEMTR
jgi:hypothetical protein